MPTGTPSAAATSWYDRPRSSRSTTACCRTSGSAPRALTRRSRSIRIAAPAVVVSLAPWARSSCNSTSWTEGRARRRSRQWLRQIRRSQVWRGASPRKAAQAAVRPDEALLSGVLGLLAIAEDAGRVRAHQALVAGDQLPEGLLVAAAQASEELVISVTARVRHAASDPRARPGADRMPRSNFPRPPLVMRRRPPAPGDHAGSEEHRGSPARAGHQRHRRPSCRSGRRHARRVIADP